MSKKRPQLTREEMAGFKAAENSTMTEKQRQTIARDYMSNMSKAEFEWKKMPIDLQRGYRAGAKDALEIVQLYISPSKEADEIIKKIKALTK